MRASSKVQVARVLETDAVEATASETRRRLTQATENKGIATQDRFGVGIMKALDAESCEVIMCRRQVPSSLASPRVRTCSRWLQSNQRVVRRSGDSDIPLRASADEKERKNKRRPDFARRCKEKSQELSKSLRSVWDYTRHRKDTATREWDGGSEGEDESKSQALLVCCAAARSPQILAGDK